MPSLVQKRKKQEMTRRRFFYAGAAATFSTIVAGTGTAIWMQQKTQTLFADLCEPTRRIEEAIMFVMDTSDIYDEVHRKRADALLMHTLQKASPGAQVTLIGLGTETGEDRATGKRTYLTKPSVLARACHPGDSSLSHFIYDDVEARDEAWQSTFVKPLQDGLDKAINLSGSSWSPLLETVEMVLQDPGFDNRVPNRRLVISSDMLQLSKGSGEYTHFVTDDRLAAFRSSSLYQLLNIDLRGVDVTIDYLQRPKWRQYQNTAHRQFWYDVMVQDYGANSLHYIGQNFEPEKVTASKTLAELGEG